MPKAKYKRRTAYHEAGHAVALAHFRLKIKKVTIVTHGESCGLTKGSLATNLSRLEYDESGRMRLNVERDVIVFLAGTAAQREFMPRSVKYHQGSHDRENTAILLQRITHSEEERRAYLKLLEIWAKQLMKRPFIRVQVEALAKQLLIHRTIDGKQASAIMQGAVEKAVAARQHKIK